MLRLLLQVPPTPTAWAPDGTESQTINMPDISLWDSAPLAVGFWNEIPGEAIALFQVLIILGIAAAIVSIIINLVNQITTDEE